MNRINTMSNIAANSIIEKTKGQNYTTVRVKRDDIYNLINEKFMSQASDEEKKKVLSIFSAWKKGESVSSQDGQYELKTFIMGIYSKYLNLRSSRIWVYEIETQKCYEYKAWSIRKLKKKLSQEIQ